MRTRLGSEAKDFFASLNQSPETSIFLNPSKTAGHPSKGEPIAWNPEGRYLAERPSYVADPHYHAGAYYPQEASSMLVRAVVEQLPIGKAPFCLDLCAAPGGKSIGLLEAIGPHGFLVSNEVIRARTKILIENLRKWGNLNWAPASAHPKVWSQQVELFDLVLVDAPCSGEGMFRKEPNALTEWSLSNVEFCSQRQSSILTDITPCVKQGGFLIYSTCTYSEEENENMMAHLMHLGMEPFKVSLPEEWGFVTVGSDGNAYQAYPHRLRGEGFFISVFRKGRGDSPPEISTDERADVVGDPLALQIPAGFELMEREGEYRLVSKDFADQLQQLKNARILLEKGLKVGYHKGAHFIPSHDIVMTGLLSEPSCVSLDLKQAISYLRRETFPLDDVEDGWHLVTYEGTALGWIKMAAGRMKNHYPKEWMIRKRW